MVIVATIDPTAGHSARSTFVHPGYIAGVRLVVLCLDILNTPISIRNADQEPTQFPTLDHAQPFSLQP